MKALKLMLASLFLTSCLSSHGIEEPLVLTRIIVDRENTVCIPRELCPIEEKQIKDMIGFQCVSPEASSRINTHHEILHRELNKCKNDLQNK